MLTDLEKELNFRTKLFCASAIEEGNISDSLNNVFKQLEKLLTSEGLSKNSVIKQVVFVNCSDNNTFEIAKEQIFTLSKSFFNYNIPLTIVPQPPVEGSICAEFVYLGNVNVFQPQNRSFHNFEYLALKTNFGEIIISPGLHEYSEKSDLYSQSIAVFEKAKSILNHEGLNFSNVIRQWNYIEKIIELENIGQHYQVFNDVRTKYYDECNFTDGYPAATGIGMEAGGVIIDFIALKKNANTTIRAIKSPVQADAHRYSEKVLADAIVSLEKLKTTPKFERAKSICIENQGLFFISGTAAIKGESSAPVYTCKEQTRMTLENIFSLCSYENLHYYNIQGQCKLFALRVYIKNPADFPAIKEVVSKMTHNLQVIYVKADICRPELLVEIEGYAEIIS